MGKYDDLFEEPKPKPKDGGKYADLFDQPDPKPEAPPTTGMEAAYHGFARAGSLGFAPAASAAVDTALSKIPGLRYLAEKINAIGGHPGISPVDDPSITYDQRRAEYAKRFAQGAEEHPYAERAGEVVGAAAPAFVPGAQGAAAAEGATVARTVGNALKTGVPTQALLGGVTGAGEAVSAGRPEDIGKETVRGAATGAIVGAPLTAAGAAVVAAAPKLVRSWVGKEIAGQDRASIATPTARKKLAMDLDDVQSVVERDPKLGALISKASHGSEDALGAVQQHIAERLESFRPAYGEASAAVDAVRPVRVGDYVDHLEHTARELRASGKGSDEAVADQIQKAAERIKGAAQWGGGRQRVLDEAERMPGGLTVGDVKRNYERLRDRATTPDQKAAAEAALANLVETHGRIRDYNPDRVVPLSRLRENVSDLQTTAADAFGTINATTAHKKARAVAAPAEDFLRTHLDRAAEANPAVEDSVNAIRGMNSDISALKNIRSVVNQRVEKAQVAGSNAPGVPNTMHGLIHKALGHSPLAAAGAAGLLGHPALGAGIAAGHAALGAAPVANRALARLIVASQRGSVPASVALEAIQAGVPNTVVQQFAGANVVNDLQEPAP